MDSAKSFLAAAALSFALCSGPLLAHGNHLSIGSVEAIPGDDVSLVLEAVLPQPIVGYQAVIEYPSFAMKFLGASLEGTDLETVAPETFQHDDNGSGIAIVKLVLDSTSPFTTTLGAGADRKVGRLHFRLVQGLSPGNLYPVSLRTTGGQPARDTVLYLGAANVRPDELTAGGVKIVDRNILRVRNLDGVLPGTLQVIEIAAFNVSPLQGFSLGLRFDPRALKILSVDLNDTITKAVGAEYMAPLVDNPNGQLVLGVLLDSLPPFDNQTIPASGIELTIARVNVQVLTPPAGLDTFLIELVDGLGAPPIRTLFVVDNQSIAPEKQNGRVKILTDGPFIRGDVNRDGKLDISDPIATGDWLYKGARVVSCTKSADTDDDGDTDLTDIVYSLLFLFDRGGDIPQPYPTAGIDPTPDNLRCPN